MSEERFIVRAGTGCSLYYCGTDQQGSPLFAPHQGAAMRFGSYDGARTALRLIVRHKAGQELLSTMRPVRLVSPVRIRLGPVTTGRARS